MPAEIHRKELKTLVSQGRAQLVDVTSVANYRKEHLPKAINIPLEKLRSESTRQLRREDAVIVYSADYSSDLSARAAWRLESMGFHEVYRYTPGLSDWLAAGYETEGTHARKAPLLKPGRPNVATCSLRDRLRDVKNRYAPGEQDVCVVVNDRNIVLGLIRGDAWNGEPLAVISDLMDPNPQTFRPNQDPAEVLKVMRKHDVETALVTTSDGELLGVLRQSRKRAPRPRKVA
jgi:rhodanese-related sulfurtransferase